MPKRLSPPELPVTPLLSSNNAALGDPVAVTPNDEVTDSEILKPNENGRGNGVTAKSVVDPNEDQETIIL